VPFLIEPSTEIATRYDFPLLANARGYLDAVEVGTDQCVFARDFLSRFRGNWLICVDPYAPHEEFPYDRIGDMIVAANALAPYHGRFRIVRGRSPEAVPWVCTFVAPAFVYIDGAHDEASVTADLEAWWDVIPDGGMLAGHDWDEAHPGVTGAVERFARERELVVRLTQEPAFPPSWYVYKGGEPAVLYHRFFRDGESPNPHASAPATSPPA
jgi:hypothetical protein